MLHANSYEAKLLKPLKTVTTLFDICQVETVRRHRLQTVHALEVVHTLQIKNSLLKS